MHLGKTFVLIILILRGSNSVWYIMLYVVWLYVKWLGYMVELGNRTVITVTVQHVFLIFFQMVYIIVIEKMCS